MRWIFRGGKLTLPLVACAMMQLIQSTNASDNALPVQPSNVQKIIDCLTNGKEAVLLIHAVKCNAYGTAPQFHRTKSWPRSLEIAKACRDWEKHKSAFQGDMRILPGSAIKEIAARHEGLAKSVGIRIIGAIFCDRLDLVGLEINQSLVLDKSVFAKGIDGRGFRTHGDLSVESSRILAPLAHSCSYRWLCIWEALPDKAPRDFGLKD
jgi:hypothetical protein